jgi:hypothetical protein
VYESCWILIEKYVLVFRVSCWFFVDFSFVIVFGGRSLDPDFLGHDFSQSLTQSTLIFSHPALNLHPVCAQRTPAQRAPCCLCRSSIPQPAIAMAAPCSFKTSKFASVFCSREALCGQDFRFPVFRLGVRLPLLL